MFPRIVGRVVEWVKAHKQFGLEFEDRGSRTWVFVRTWRRDSFYRVAVGLIDRYHGDVSSELVILREVVVVVGHLWCQLLGGHTPLLRATRSIWEAGVCAECSITRLLMSGCSNGACKKLLPLCSGRSTHFRWLSSSWPVSKELSIVIGCNRGNRCEGRLRQVTSPCLG